MSDLTVGRVVRLHAAVLGGLLGTAMPAFAAAFAPVPQVDGTSMSTGVGLVACGALWLRARRRSS